MEIHPFIKSARRLFEKTQQALELSFDGEDGTHHSNLLESTVAIYNGASGKVEPDSLPEEVKRRYIIRKLLGKGAFGTVFLAEDRKIGRLVAVKQLFKSKEEDTEIYERFMQEARICAQLEHPNIINVFSLEEDSVSACIIMEYLGGGSLASYILREGRIDFKTAVRIITGVLTGLGAAHGVMVIHRDIKPQNILFGPHGEPKLSDFGVAYLPVIAGGMLEEARDSVDKVIGTPLYMAPEQISSKPYDHRVDLYAAGAVLYEMLTGRKIFKPKGDITINTMRNIIMTIEPDPIEPSLGVPPKLVSVMMKILSKNPSARFPDAKSTINALSELFIPAQPQEPPSQTGSAVGLGNFGPIPSSPAAMLEDVIRLFLVDGGVSPAERRELERRAERLGINKSQASAIEEKVRQELSLPALEAINKYSSFIEEIILSSEKNEIPDYRKDEIEGKRKSLGIAEEEAAHILRHVHERIKYIRWIEEKKTNS